MVKLLCLQISLLSKKVTMPKSNKLKARKVPKVISAKFARDMERISWNRMAIFGAVFGLFGAYFLFRSFALTPQYYGASLTKMTAATGVDYRYPYTISA